MTDNEKWLWESNKRLMEIVQQQNKTIQDLNHRNSRLQEELLEKVEREDLEPAPKVRRMVGEENLNL